MTFELTNIVLFGIIIILVIVIAYIIGKKSTKRNTISYNRVSNSNLTTVNPILKNEKISKRDKNNPKHLSRIKTMLDNKIPEYSEFIIDIVANSGFGYHFSSLCDFLEENNEDIEIGRIEETINWIKVNEMKTNFETGYLLAAGFIVDTYKDFLENVEIKYDEPILKKFKLSDDHSLIENNKIISILKQNTSPFYSELNELHSLQNKLNNQLPRARDLLKESKFDIPGMAKNFGLGAVAGINPFIGIPLLLNNWFGENKKNKSNNQFIEDFFKIYDKYLMQWDKLREMYEPIYEQQQIDMLKKCKTSLNDNIMIVLTKLDEKGHSLKKSLKIVEGLIKMLDKEKNELLKEDN
ncbi:hypothetical protein ACFL7D_04760 [candidate division KSB1 bacterium]